MADTRARLSPPWTTVTAGLRLPGLEREAWREQVCALERLSPTRPGGNDSWHCRPLPCLCQTSPVDPGHEEVPSEDPALPRSPPSAAASAAAPWAVTLGSLRSSPPVLILLSTPHGANPSLGGHDGMSYSVTGTLRPPSLVTVPALWPQTDPGTPVSVQTRIQMGIQPPAQTHLVLCKLNLPRSMPPDPIHLRLNNITVS